MRAGQLRNPVIVQSPVDTRTATGRPTRTWSTWAKTWAAIRPLTGTELQSAQALEGQVTHEVRVRYMEGLTPKMRIVHGTRSLEIVSVMDVMERQRELVINAREVVT